MALFNNLAQVRISSITNLLHVLPDELLNDLRLRILGNKEILEKYQIWVDTQPSVQSSFQKLNFDSSCQKTRKIRWQIFEVLSIFTGFLYFVPNVFARIVVIWFAQRICKMTGFYTRCNTDLKYNTVVSIWLAEYT